ncbi:MAG: hypothetical protein A2840_00775 [Candidatus Buchananbacteria bacterium RIFCSPHIGHO2_01_FULL_47_11b]|uniref:Type 4 fimbrial biogenesis protein PilX N-terminal domain-containing protein n=1 Tax=Candidatus Buchananbacteria bacterium RIFCSPHIGHO2_01_FULL_47_11b TaxID=1797537 RepID=A0A1G1Y268_9BACT|nr:MAG: hypothetical protein A2840_00775 [Candidatus Buchananbacteria bacterium RIFCSPHIGHO2_01_FULL_47_11b]
MKPSGQSLLETVFAIGILLIVVTAILGLTRANLVGQQESEFQVLANNLAREGVEVIRLARDSNWLAAVPWNTGLVGGSAAIVDFNSATGNWAIAFNPTISGQKLYTDTNGTFSHNPTGNPTLLSRVVNLSSICQDSGGVEIITSDPTDCNGLPYGLEVRSVVSWEERGLNRSVTLQNLLYAWK